MKRTRQFASLLRRAVQSAPGTTENVVGVEQRRSFPRARDQRCPRSIACRDDAARARCRLEICHGRFGGALIMNSRARSSAPMCMKPRRSGSAGCASSNILSVSADAAEPDGETGLRRQRCAYASLTLATTASAISVDFDRAFGAWITMAASVVNRRAPRRSP